MIAPPSKSIQCYSSGLMVIFYMSSTVYGRDGTNPTLYFHWFTCSNTYHFNLCYAGFYKIGGYEEMVRLYPAAISNKSLMTNGMLQMLGCVKI